MKTMAKRLLVVLLIVLIYFTVWRGVRGFVTQSVIIPQIEYAISHCDDTIHYHPERSTSVYIHLLNAEQTEYETFGYISPGGFYLLFGLVFIVLLGGGKIYYLLLFGYHLAFWILSTASILPGLCWHRAFIHVTFAGITYFTPFVTFLIIILMISPKLVSRFRLEKNLMNESNSEKN